VMSVAERVESATDLVSVRLDRLVPDPTNRPLTDDSPEVLALVSSVREHGVSVTALAEGLDQRRDRHAVLVGVPLPAVVRRRGQPQHSPNPLAVHPP